MKRWLMLGALCASTLARAAEPAAPGALTDALRAQRLEIHLDHGALAGPGAQWLQRESAKAQFVLVGEEHGTADIPQFAEALWRELAVQGVQHLVLESGPWSTARIEHALRESSDGLAKLNTAYPTGLPFFGWQEDGSLAAAAVRSSKQAPALWGIDQEFILSARMHFDRLAELGKDTASRDLAKSYAVKARAAYATIIEKHDPGAALLLQLQEADFNALRQAFAKAPPEARELIEALAQSARIYHDQNDAPYDSNLARSRMMKRYFMAAYREAQKKEPMPRAMFRLGAFHSIRGQGPRNLLDIGNLASELAASNGSTSLHVLVIPAGGETNRWFPFAPEEAAKHAPYDAKEELAEVGALPIFDAADKTEWSLFPTAFLRSQRALRTAGGAEFERMVFGYDAVVVIPRVRAATLYGDTQPAEKP